MTRAFGNFFMFLVSLAARKISKKTKYQFDRQRSLSNQSHFLKILKKEISQVEYIPNSS